MKVKNDNHFGENLPCIIICSCTEILKSKFYRAKKTSNPQIDRFIRPNSRIKQFCMYISRIIRRLFGSLLLLCGTGNATQAQKIQNFGLECFLAYGRVEWDSRDRFGERHGDRRIETPMIFDE